MKQHEAEARPALPIDDVLGDLSDALTRHTRAVLVAPPGAGKTTIVPLALRNADWLAGQRILVLEPRRLAARAAAARMAALLGEHVGETVGVRARLATQVGPSTRIEVITEGVFTRMIIDDPSLEGIGAVLFDEFHERSLDADLGLSLALDAQAGLREDLRLLVMSATLDGARVAAILGDAPEITSAGRMFPVETRYLARAPGERIEQATVRAVREALANETGSVLVFLPGQAEIRRVHEQLAGHIDDAAVIVAPLYGAMEMRDQDRAIQPPEAGRRKVVLATAIAETSLTIEGVRIVIDAGLARVPRFDPGARMTRLETVRASRASIDQRRGRAGRTGPGVCYRLWSEPETQGLVPFTPPEINAADLAGLVLDCAAWGVTDPLTLTWLDPPPAGALDAARTALRGLGALDPTGRLTVQGEALRSLAMPPHLAAMVIGAAMSDQADAAARLAALLVERGIGGRSIDIAGRLQALDRDRGGRARQMRDLARRWAQTAAKLAPASRSPARPRSLAGLLALAFPDRIAKRRGTGGRFLMAGGRGAVVAAEDALHDAEYLVVADLQGTATAPRVLAAAEIDPAELEDIASDRIEEIDILEFDTAARAVRARRTRRLGAITLQQQSAAVPRTWETAAILARGISEQLGIDALPWSKAQAQLRARVRFLRESDPAFSELADLSDATLASSHETWLAPFLVGKTSLAEIGADDLATALDSLLPYELRKRLDAAAPTHFTAPTGNRHAINYTGEHAPSVAVRVQELFGLRHHPAIAEGRLPLTLQLLSPAQRPIQVTRDLPGFWEGSWHDVKADMKGRYPKHVWPDDPAHAAPTARAKPRR